VGELVGRSQELGRLLALLEDARAGRVRAALVLGEAGIGKTRLTEAFAAAAAQAEIRVAWGRCTDAESPAYWPWRQLLRALHGSTSLGLTTDGTSGRDVLFATVANELEQVAAAVGPMVLVVDDIHWADPSSLALLRFVVSVLPDLPAVLVLTARDDPLELSKAAADLLRDLPSAVQRIPLGGLDSDSTYALVKGMWGAAPAGFVSEVHKRTSGNPFFVQEVTNLRLLQGERPGFAVPPGVGQIVGRRLARLSQLRTPCSPSARCLTTSSTPSCWR
jgi:predicted ATPase